MILQTDKNEFFALKPVPFQRGYTDVRKCSSYEEAERSLSQTHIAHKIKIIVMYVGGQFIYTSDNILNKSDGKVTKIFD